MQMQKTQGLKTRHAIRKALHFKRVSETQGVSELAEGGQVTSRLKNAGGVCGRGGAAACPIERRR